jgi:hypothetical protein
MPGRVSGGGSKAGHGRAVASSPMPHHRGRWPTGGGAGRAASGGDRVLIRMRMPGSRAWEAAQCAAVGDGKEAGAGSWEPMGRMDGVTLLRKRMARLLYLLRPHERSPAHGWMILDGEIAE